MDEISSALPATAPSNSPQELYTVINDLYLQLYSLTAQLNRRTNIIRSPNGNYWRVSVSNTGVLITTNLGATY